MLDIAARFNGQIKLPNRPQVEVNRCSVHHDEYRVDQDIMSLRRGLVVFMGLIESLLRLGLNRLEARRTLVATRLCPRGSAAKRRRYAESANL